MEAALHGHGPMGGHAGTGLGGGAGTDPGGVLVHRPGGVLARTCGGAGTDPGGAMLEQIQGGHLEQTWGGHAGTGREGVGTDRGDTLARNQGGHTGMDSGTHWYGPRAHRLWIPRARRSADWNTQPMAAVPTSPLVPASPCCGISSSPPENKAERGQGGGGGGCRAMCAPHAGPGSPRGRCRRGRQTDLPTGAENTRSTCTP